MYYSRLYLHTGHVSITVESDGAGKPRQSVVKLPLQAKVIPTPPRQ